MCWDKSGQFSHYVGHLCVCTCSYAYARLCEAQLTLPDKRPLSPCPLCEETHRPVQDCCPCCAIFHYTPPPPPFLSCLSLFPRNLWFPPRSTQMLTLPQAWLISPLAFFKQVAHVWQRPPTHTRSHHSSIPSLSPGKTLNPLTRSLIQPQASRRAQKALGRMAVDSSVCL